MAEGLSGIMGMTLDPLDHGGPLGRARARPGGKRAGADDAG
jgi:hypothetical protein